MRLYAARLGLVIQPHPRGAFSPSEFRTYRFHDSRAATRLRIDGRQNPHFMAAPQSQLLPVYPRWVVVS